MRSAQVTVVGSSPQARGAAQAGLHVLLGAGTIPAGTGEQASPRFALMSHLGPSPRVRGARRERPGAGEGTGTIPAVRGALHCTEQAGRFGGTIPAVRGAQ